MHRWALLAGFFVACSPPDAAGVLEADRSDGISAPMHLSSSTCTISSDQGRLMVKAELPLPGGGVATLELDGTAGASYAEPGFEASGATGTIRILDSAAQMGRFDLTFARGPSTRRLGGTFAATRKAAADDSSIDDDGI